MELCRYNILQVHHLPFELINQMTEQVLAVNIMTEELLQRARIRGIAEELRLVYVKPDANDAVLYPVLAQGVLDKNTANLRLSNIDIVRPLHLALHLRILMPLQMSHGLGHRIGYRHRNEELFRRLHIHWVYENAERKVFARR